VCGMSQEHQKSGAGSLLGIQVFLVLGASGGSGFWCRTRSISTAEPSLGSSYCRFVCAVAFDTGPKTTMIGTVSSPVRSRPSIFTTAQPAGR
jgi:hypothetical protein